jgi:glycerol-3-phosphate dehydrogenase
VVPELPYTFGECAYLCNNEWVLHLADLIRRRTSLYFLADHSEEYLPMLAEYIAPVTHWNAARQKQEVDLALREFSLVEDVPM